MENSVRQAIRVYELSKVLQFMPSSGSVLEIGAGAGWQAKILSEKGYQVSAIDLIDSNYKDEQIFPIHNYDGLNIPFPDHHFDIVFSSNVLEHIEHVTDIQHEIRRVLRPGGIAIHVLPTGVWRVWTNVAFYVFKLKKIFLLFINVLLRTKMAKGSKTTVKSGQIRRSGIFYKVIKLIFPTGHGAKGNCISEIYLFSRVRWKKLFTQTGWCVIRCIPGRLFYTGHLVMGFSMSIRVRHFLSFLLGSTSQIYVLRTTESNEAG